MWPLSLAMPRYKESFLVTFADKYSATIEVFLGYKKIFSHRKHSVAMNTVSLSNKN